MINEDLFYEDEDKFYKETLFNDIDDCDYCPFRDSYDEDGFCSKSPDGNHPCESNYDGMTVEEVIDYLRGKRSTYEAHLEDKWRREQLEKEKKAKAAEKRMQTKWENIDLDSELKRINKSIKAKRELLIKITSFANAVAFADHMMYHKSIPEKKDKHPLELQIEQLEQRILEIKAEKKERAKKRRKKQKEVK